MLAKKAKKKKPAKKDHLTPKQTLFVKESSLYKQIVFMKLDASRKLAIHMGLIAPCRALKIKKEELQRRIDKHGTKYISACVCILSDKNATSIQHVAAGLLLEFFIPEWRNILPIEFAGRATRRRDREVRLWKIAVLNRDAHACVKCGEKKKIAAHHIVRWVDAPELRLDVDNGMTLCTLCHNKEHGKETHQQRQDICS